MFAIGVKVLLTGLVLLFVGPIVGDATVGNDRLQRLTIGVCVTGLSLVVAGFMAVIWA